MHLSQALPSQNAESRLDAVPAVCRFCGHQSPPILPWDEVLAEMPEAYAVPTKGALLAPWVLIIPRQHVLSTAALRSSERESFGNFASAIASKLGSRVVYFEHGPSRRGTPIGCGVDHAHLHALVFEDEFERWVRSADESLVWMDSVAPWENALLRERSYYAFSEDGSSWRTTVDPPAQRQFFRRAIATALGHPDRFDYEVYPSPENAVLTRAHWNRGK